ncbi:MAG: M3 family metallopeptidase [Actinomycetota bacterium]
MLYDYTTVTAASVLTEVEGAITGSEELLAAVVAPQESRTWESTMAPLDRIAAAVIIASGRGPFMARVHPDKEVRDAAQAAEERLSKWVSDLAFRRDLYEAVETYAATPEAAALEGEDTRLLAFTRRDLRRAGHGLTPEQRTEVQRLRTRLVELGVAFARNIDEYQDGLDLTREDLDGLPEDYLSRLSPGAAAGTFRVSLDYPEYYPFMDQARRADLRRALQFKMFNQAREQNLPILEEAVRLRHEIARLFGLPSWAHYGMEEKMAREPAAVESFYAGLTPPLTEKSRAELAELAAANGGVAAEPWDFRYLHTLVRRERFGIDPSEVAAYFPLEQVVQGMFDLTGEVLGLEYRRLEGVAVWHPDVAAYEIADRASGRPLATFYADLFPREGKFGHAAAFDLVPAHQGDGEYTRPVTAIAANFTKPSATQPSLLQHDEVVTLFHEFGHVLHNSLGHTRRVRFAGFNTEWDFVEAPSQIMEHWCWTPAVLQRFARHHQTGEPIPAAVVEQLAAARDLHVALLTLRQISFGLLDMAFHGPAEAKDLFAIARETTAVTGFPLHEATFYPAGFGHLFGYDAGYYGYLWAKVFGDDMFSRFEAEGLTSPAVGGEYRRKVLERGGSVDASELLRDFLGREPSQQAFLHHLGLA